MSLDVYLTAVRPTEVFTANITHNLGKMANEAGIYEHLWHPANVNIFKAEQLIAPLTAGLEALERAPAYFQQFNPENGWGGGYFNLVQFVRAYLAACKENPDAEVSVDT